MITIGESNINDFYFDITSNLNYDITSLLDGNNLNIKNVKTTTDSTLILTNDCNVYGWGVNQYGELGLGHNIEITELIHIASNISKIDCGQNHSLFLDLDGIVHSCGKNSLGQLGLSNYTDINTLSNINLENIEDISAGDNLSVFKKTNGEIYWCGKYDTQINNIPQYLSSNVSKILADKNDIYYVDNTSNIYINQEYIRNSTITNINLNNDNIYISDDANSLKKINTTIINVTPPTVSLSTVYTTERMYPPTRDLTSASHNISGQVYGDGLYEVTHSNRKPINSNSQTLYSDLQSIRNDILSKFSLFFDVITIKTVLEGYGYKIIATPKRYNMAEYLSYQDISITSLGKFNRTYFDGTDTLKLSNGFSITDLNNHPYMCFALLNGDGLVGIATMLFRDWTDDGTKQIKDIFYPTQNSGSGHNLYTYVLNADGTEVSDVGGSTNWNFSNGQNAGTNGYYSPWQFSEDDGIWGFSIGRAVGGNGAGASMINYQNSYGIENYDAGDDQDYYMWNNTQYINYNSDFALYVFVKTNEITYGANEGPGYNVFNNDISTTLYKTLSRSYTINTYEYIIDSVDTITGIEDIGDWIKIKLPNEINLTGYKLVQDSTLTNNSPGKYKIYGSKDDSNWVEIVNKNIMITYTSYEFTEDIITNDTFNYFALVVTSLIGNGEILVLDEWYIYGKEVIANIEPELIYTDIKRYPETASTGSYNGDNKLAQWDDGQYTVKAKANNAHIDSQFGLWELFNHVITNNYDIFHTTELYNYTTGHFTGGTSFTFKGIPGVNIIIDLGREIYPFALNMAPRNNANIPDKDFTKNAPGLFKVYGSNNSDSYNDNEHYSWTLILDQKIKKKYANNTYTTYNLDSTNKYRYFAINFTEIYGNAALNYGYLLISDMYFDGIEADISVIPDYKSVTFGYGEGNVRYPVLDCDTQYLIAHYKFDGNYTDSTGNKADAIPSVGTDGIAELVKTHKKIGEYSLKLLSDSDGTKTYVSLPSFQFGDTVTICLWFNWDLTNSYDSSANKIVYFKNNQATDRIFIGRDTSNKKIYFTVECVGKNRIDYKITNTIIEDNTWYHIVWVIDNTNPWRVYVNGVYIQPTTALPNTTTSGQLDTSITFNENYIGRHGDSNTDNWDGYLDDFRIYDKALTEEEVNSLYNQYGQSKYEITFTNSIECDILIVAGGGGGGGSPYGGGGGAGGILLLEKLSLESGTYTIKVGKGGDGGNGKITSDWYNQDLTRRGQNGSDSSFDIYEAIGGGGGARYQNMNGIDGGSGGGNTGSSNSTPGSALQPTSTYGGFGNRGGESSFSSIAGGGGGAGAAGDNYSIGGEGKYFEKFKNYGSPLGWYGGGGGGSRYDGYYRYHGGKGGGGAGGVSKINQGEGLAGIDGTGGGGGGAERSGTGNGGNGGSGIVIIHYRTKTTNLTNYTGTYNKIEKGLNNLFFTSTDNNIYSLNDITANTNYGTTTSINSLYKLEFFTDKIVDNIFSSKHKDITLFVTSNNLIYNSGYLIYNNLILHSTDNRPKLINDIFDIDLVNIIRYKNDDGYYLRYSDKVLYNDKNEYIVGNIDSNNIKKIDRTINSTVILTKEGTVYIDGSVNSIPYDEIINIPEEIIIDISCGYEHVLFRTANKKLYVLGNNSKGQLGTGNTANEDNPQQIDINNEEDIEDIICGYYSSIVKTNSNYYITGNDGTTQYSNFQSSTIFSYTDIKKIIARNSVSILDGTTFHGKKEDGTYFMKPNIEDVYINNSNIFFKQTDGNIINEDGDMIYSNNDSLTINKGIIDNNDNLLLSYKNNDVKIDPDIEYQKEWIYTNDATYYMGNVAIGKIGATEKLDIEGTLSTNYGKQFKITHPLDSNMWLYHSSIECPRNDNIYRGETIIKNGYVEVNIDKECNTTGGMIEGTFKKLNKNSQLFLQNNDTFDNVKGNIDNNIIKIYCENKNKDIKVNWIIIGERDDDEIKKLEITDISGCLICEHLISR